MQVNLIDRKPTLVAYLRNTGPYGEPIAWFWQERAYPWLASNDLFHGAKELPVSERARFLDEHSPNLEIRQQVERLLSGTPRTRLAKGDIIGHHVIESKLGEGGRGPPRSVSA